MKRVIAISLSLAMVFMIAGACLADLNDGLVAYYPFNGNANDESGNGKHGMVSEAALSNDRFGDSYKAYNFDGADDYIKVENLDYQFSNALSFSVWINPVNAQKGVIINKWVYAAEDKSLTFTSDQKISFCLAGPTGSLSCFTPTMSDSIIPLNQWTHLAAVYDGSAAKIYINGVLDISQSASGNIFNYDGKLYFGFNPDRIGEYNFPFKGKLDEVRIYNRALTQAEIQQLYLYNDKDSGICVYTQAQLDQAVKTEQLKWDANGDGKIGLEDIIRMLQVIAGLRP